MSSVNKVFLVGRVGKDPEVKEIPSGSVANFSIATSEKYKEQEITEWSNCVAFGKLAEIIGQYVVKGSQIFVSGKLRTEKFTDKNGVEKYSTKIIVSEMQMLGSKPESSNKASAPKQEAATIDDSDIPF